MIAKMAKLDVETYKRIFCEAPAAIVVLSGREGLIELISDEARRIRPASNPVGKTMREAWPELEGQGLFNVVEHVFDTGKRTILTEARFSFEPERDGRSVTEYWNLTVQPRHDVAGKIVGTVVFGIEMTETVLGRRALEDTRERLEFAQEAGGIGTFEWVIATNEVIWTEQLEDQYHLPRGSFEGTYDAWTKRVHPDDLDMAVNWVQRAVAERVPMNMEFRILWPDGSERWLLARAKVLLDESGEPKSFIGMSIDITERKQLEQRLKDANDRITNILEDILDGSAR